MARIHLDDDKLIELVRKHSVLYNLSHPKYLDNKLKDNIWGVIGRQLDVEGALCKSRWNNIRDQYRKRVKDVEMKTARGAKLIKLYKYSEQLEFLKPFFKENKSYTQEDGAEEEDYDHIKLESCEDPLNYVQISSVSSHDSEASNQNLNDMECLPKKAEFEGPHEIDAFLAGMAPTLKKLSPYLQHLAKSELFAVVHKYEMEMLKEENKVPQNLTEITKTEPLI